MHNKITKALMKIKITNGKIVVKSLLQTDKSMFVCVFVRLFYAAGNGAQVDSQQQHQRLLILKQVVTVLESRPR